MKLLKLGRRDLYVKVDDDFEMPAGSLVLASNGYPKIMRCTGNRRPSGSYIYEETYLHHVIMGKPPKGLEVDHRNGDKLDARKSEMRFGTRGQNASNIPARKGRYLGVHQARSRKDGSRRFVAQITQDYKIRHLGTFPCEREAAAAYNTAAAEIHGEFARLNVL